MDLPLGQSTCVGVLETRHGNIWIEWHREPRCVINALGKNLRWSLQVLLSHRVLSKTLKLCRGKNLFWQFRFKFWNYSLWLCGNRVAPSACNLSTKMPTHILTLQSWWARQFRPQHKDTGRNVYRSPITYVQKSMGLTVTKMGRQGKYIRPWQEIRFNIETWTIKKKTETLHRIISQQFK